MLSGSYQGATLPPSGHLAMPEVLSGSPLGNVLLCLLFNLAKSKQPQENFLAQKAISGTADNSASITLGCLPVGCHVTCSPPIPNIMPPLP